MTTVNLSSLGGAGWQFFDDNGVPLAGGKLFTYNAGTTTPAVTYADNSGLVANSNPIILDAAGRTPNEIWLPSAQTYKFILKDFNDVEIWSFDNVPSILDPASFDALSGPNGSSLIGFIQAGAGAVARTVQDKLREEPSSPRDFGAKLDGITDDTLALQAYADALAAAGDSSSTNGLTAKNKPIFYIPPCAGAVITSPLLIKPNINVIMDGPILVSAPASTANTWVQIGLPVTANQQCRNMEYRIDVRRITQSDWVSENDVGCFIITAASKIWPRRLDNFTIGLQVTAPYSQVIGGEFRNNKYGLDVTSSTLGFANQMQIYGGEYACAGGVGPGLSRYGIRLRRGTGTSALNAIVVHDCSFELNSATAGAAETFSILADNVTSAQFYDLRFEGSGLSIAKLINDCRWIHVRSIYGYEFSFPQINLLTDQSTYKIGNKAVLDGQDYDWSQAYQVYDTGNLSDIATKYSSTQWHFENLEFAVQNGSVPCTFAKGGVVDAINYKDKSVDLATNSYLGCRIDTRKAKQFALVVDKAAAQDMAALVTVFDSTGTQLKGSTDVLQNTPTPGNTANPAIYGGAYLFTSGLDNDRNVIFFTFSDSVATAFIGVAQGVIRSMRVYANIGTASAFSASTVGFKNLRVASVVPAAGFYVQGTSIWNDAAAAAGSPGWVCTTTGETGTLVGVTADTFAGSRSVTFSDASNLAIGYAITIGGVAGTKIIQALQDNVAYVDSNCSATVTGGAVAYVAPVFKAMANLAP